MNSTETFKIACPHCAQHVEFSAVNYGDVTSCPNCGCSVALIVPGYRPPPVSPLSDSINPALANHRENFRGGTSTGKHKDYVNPFLMLGGVLFVIAIVFFFLFKLISTGPTENPEQNRQNSEHLSEFVERYDDLIYKVEAYHDGISIHIAPDFKGIPFDQKRFISAAIFEEARRLNPAVDHAGIIDAVDGRKLGTYSRRGGLNWQ
jgi:hypothetical protein